MSDYAGLALVLVALYGSECFVWARHGALVVTAPWLRGPRMRVLSRLGTARGAFTPLNPLPPFGYVYIVEPWPFSLSVAGVVAARSFSLAGEPLPLESGRVLAWPEVVKVRVIDKDVHVASSVFARCSSAAHARAAARVLSAVAASGAFAGGEPERARTIDQLSAAHLDVDDARARAQLHAKASAPLLIAQGLVFASLFLLAPVVIFATGLRYWPYLLASVYGSVLLCAALLYIAHGKLAPEARAERWWHALLMLPAPTMAMRGNDKLGRHLLAGLHPLAVALGVLSPSARDDVVGRALRDLATPRRTTAIAAMSLTGTTDHARAVAIELAFRERVLHTAKELAHKHGVDVDGAFAAPQLRAGQRAWCPRCRLAFRQPGTCSDCGVPLRAQ